MRSALLPGLLMAPLLALVILAGLLAPGPQIAAAQDAPAAPIPSASDPPPFISFRVYLPQLYRSAGLTDPFPTDGAGAQSLNTFLAWSLADPGAGDRRFTVLLEANDETPDVVIASGLTAPHFASTGLELDTIYYWQVIVAGADGVSSAGPVWRFRTEP